MSALGNLSGDVQDWRVDHPDPIRPVKVRVYVQSYGHEGHNADQWYEFDLDRRNASDDALFAELIAELQAECPKS